MCQFFCRWGELFLKRLGHSYVNAYSGWDIIYCGGYHSVGRPSCGGYHSVGRPICGGYHSVGRPVWYSGI